MSGSNQHRIALVAARKQRGWSQADLGNAVGTAYLCSTRLRLRSMGYPSPNMPVLRVSNGHPGESVLRVRS
jgi:hypothetical protein